ncbi:cytochrome P450 1A1-like isoform X2 [Hyla sarda]|uniref:cytochrome P450 1A1-like isoform X2 n=1 Tax=Hyla sarda TaxID=327740 RepID=UPI0024C373C1|nr:cytochrome P450 1A1-like isoform X2 [Hyla sarda]
MESDAYYFPVDLLSFDVTVLLTIFTLLLVLGLRRKQRISLPGPWALPIFGNFFQIGDQAHISLTEMRKTYGDVFLIKLGMMPVVVVSGFQTVKQVLGKQGEQFADRPNMHSFSLLADGKSMTFSEKYGETWKIHKKIMRNALRTLSKSEANSLNFSCRLEEYVCAEASDLVKTIQLSKDHGGFDPSPLIVLTVANVVCALCFGKRYSHNDQEFLRIIEFDNDIRKISGAGLLADFIPVFKYFPSSGLKELKKFLRSFNDFIAKSVQDHFGSHDENNIRDITDALIKLCNSRNNIDKNYKLSNEQIISTVNDIFGAGFDTISSALLWCMVYLLKYPEMQEKIQKEIDEVIGTSRSPRFEDRKDFHYTEAFINEVLRHASFVPFTIPHCTTLDTSLNGYFLPKDTCVFINMYQVNHDPAVWSDADLFIPERFLDEYEHIDKSVIEKVFIFGMGVRKCIGEDVARNEMFIFLTSILQHLKLVKDPKNDVDLTPVFGLTMKPKPYKLKIETRL